MRELQRRLDAAQTADSEDAIIKLMEAENTRWQSAQQQPDKETT